MILLRYKNYTDKLIFMEDHLKFGNSHKIKIKGRLQKKNRKIWGFCPKRREGVISETQFLHTFNLGLLSEEGGG